MPLPRFAAVAVALALLSGCALKPKVLEPAQRDTVWAERQQRLRQVQGFEASGRVAVKGGGLSGALRWAQHGEQFALRIAGPFGAGALSVQGTPELVSIKGKDIDLTTDQPELELASRTGWRLPLDSLRWWVLGLPAPASEASVVLNDQGRAEQIRQNGWTLLYSDYRDGQSPVLPGRIEASLGEWSATLLIQTLTLQP